MYWFNFIGSIVNFINRVAKFLIKKKKDFTVSRPMFIATLFTTAKIWKPPKCPRMDKWTNKTWSFHRTENDSALKIRKSCHVVQHG